MTRVRLITGHITWAAPEAPVTAMAAVVTGGSACGWEEGDGITLINVKSTWHNVSYLFGLLDA